MNSITIQSHLFFSALISFLSLTMIGIKWRFIFKKSKKKSIWISLVVFLITYLMIVGIALFDDIYYQWDLNKYDLNMNGIFEKNEINHEQEAAFQRLINDTGRNFAIITGFVISGLISIFTFLISLGIEKYRKLRNKNYTQQCI